MISFDEFDVHAPAWARIPMVVEPLVGPTRLALDITETAGGIVFVERDPATGVELQSEVLIGGGDDREGEARDMGLSGAGAEARALGGRGQPGQLGLASEAAS